MSEHTLPALVTDPSATSFDVPAFALGAELSSLRAEARELWVPDHERASRAEIARLVGRALSMVVRALELVDIAAVLFGGDAQASGPGGEDFVADERDQRSWCVPTTPEGVASLAERARRVLRAQGQRLCTPHAGPDAEVRQPGDAERLVAVAAGMRWIELTFRLLEEALCGAEPVSPPVDSRFLSPSELLELRKRYVGFQRQVLGEGMLPGQEELGARLRSAGVALARLLGDARRSTVPAADRAALMLGRMLVRDWVLLRGTEAVHAARGERLYEGLAQLATRLLRVNQRRELLHHDAELVEQVLRDLPAPGDPWTDAEGCYVLERLRPMLGRNPTIDVMVALSFEPPSPDEVRSALEDVRRALSTAHRSTLPPSRRQQPRDTLRIRALVTPA